MIFGTENTKRGQCYMPYKPKTKQIRFTLFISRIYTIIQEPLTISYFIIRIQELVHMLNFLARLYFAITQPFLANR